MRMPRSSRWALLRPRARCESTRRAARPVFGDEDDRRARALQFGERFSSRGIGFVSQRETRGTRTRIAPLTLTSNAVGLNQYRSCGGTSSRCGPELVQMLLRHVGFRGPFAADSPYPWGTRR